MKILAIDPGTTESAYVVWDGQLIHAKGKIINADLKGLLHHCEANVMAVEMIASYGMPVGKEVFETCLFIGKLLERWEALERLPAELIYRKDIKIHHCGSMKAKDGNIRQALIDRFGVPGTKKQPGITYGVSNDIWSALAIGVYYFDKNN
ncbi:hypothetical protein UFOVP1596_18 [uncultured Caudovirales phage]|uniref:Uncharacterized protein n=1 Tax=uncultured Caudovirales phage TaxID=2100421 RepID=A0A6J5ST05_9CAUD|nr:hypothetical protein UFOVP1596_18 [uncultured Caudovirales phage]